MEIIYFLLLVIIIIIAIKDLRKNKLLPNDSYYNMLQNSRYWRLLIMVLAVITAVITVFIIKIVQLLS
jgi:hypothetical protein